MHARRLEDWFVSAHNVPGFFQEAIDKGLVDKLYLTRIRKEFDADVFFPEFSEDDFVAIR